MRAVYGALNQPDYKVPIQSKLTVSSICEYKRLKFLDSTKLIEPDRNTYFYNGCIIDNHRLFYRVGTINKGYEDKIATCLLDDSLNVIPETNKYINVHSSWSQSARTRKLKDMIPSPFKNGQHVEDPRAIIVGCSYFVFYTDGLTVGVAKLNLSCNTIYSHYLYVPTDSPVFSDSDGREKNWSPVVSDNTIYLLYSVNPLVYFKCVDKGDSLEISNVLPLNKKLYWPYGHIRGGTPATKYDDNSLLWCFHSVLYFDTHSRKMSSHYMFSVYVTTNTFPFDLIKICNLPLLIGIPSHFTKTLYLQHNVVFPCGLIKTDNGWRISMGVNDYEIAFLDVTENDFFWNE
jgi:predicted GH43/DUF377 family glycosyl hydrolase